MASGDRWKGLVLAIVWGVLCGCGSDEVATPLDPGLRTLEQGLLLHWTFEDRSGDQILDVSGQGRHGTLVGGNMFEATEDGEAVVLDGVDDAISFPAALRSPSLYGGTDGAVTLSARVRVSDVAKYNTLCVGCGPLRSVFVGTQSFGRRTQVALRDGDGGGIAWHQSSEALANDQWVEATIIAEGGVGTRTYLDCALDTEVLDPDIELADFGYSSVGTGAYSEMWFGGAIDDFRMWDRALDEDEIDALCPAGPGTPPVGLELHWTFEDREGSQILDLSGNDRHGTLRGAPTFVQGQLGDAVRLNGVNDYISMAGPRDVNLYGGVDGAMTLSARVRMSDVDRYNTLCYGCGPFRSLFVGTAPYGARMMATLYNQISGGSTWPWTTESLLEDTWTEVTMVVEGGVGARMFLDCALDSDTPNEGVGLRDYGYSSVGQGAAANQWFEGDMDELRIWSRALSQEEIAELCPEAPPVNPLAEDLELHWSFEDRLGNVIEDLSGNGRTGTMVGGTFVPSPNGEAAAFDGVDDRVAFVGPRDVDLYGGPAGDFTLTPNGRALAPPRRNTGGVGGGPMASVFLGDHEETTGSPYVIDVGNFGHAVVWQSTDNSNGGAFFPRVATPALLDEGLWFELTVVVEGGVGARIYVNGMMMGELLDPDIGLHDPGFSALGYGVSNNSFGGEVDELRIWSRALSEEDIATFGQNEPSLFLGLLAKWEFVYHVGDFILDRSGNNHNARLEGATLVPSPNGEAAQFDGVDDYMTFAGLRDPELYGGEDGAFTLSTRLRVADVDAVNTICVGCGPFASFSIGNLGAPGRAWARLFNEVTSGSLWPITTPAITDNTWVEVTLVVDGTTGAQMYVDCELDGELDNPDIGLHDYGYSSLGEGAGNNWLEGEVEMFRIWDRVLTDVEVAALCE